MLWKCIGIEYLKQRIHLNEKVRLIMVANSLRRSVDLVNSVKQALIINQLIKRTDRILISISGGQDSICLLVLLNQLYSQMELHLGLIWCHHLWQIDSFSLMRQMTKISFIFQLNSCFAVTPSPVPSELLARNWRHSSSYRICSFYNYYKKSLAHSANDKVETVLLNLMRGTGLTGLSPLNWKKKTDIQKPSAEKHISQFFTISIPSFFWSPFFFSQPKIHIVLHAKSERSSDVSLPSVFYISKKCKKRSYVTPQLIMKYNFFDIAIQCNKGFFISKKPSTPRGLRSCWVLGLRSWLLLLRNVKNLVTLFSVAGECHCECEIAKRRMLCITVLFFSEHQQTLCYFFENPRFSQVTLCYFNGKSKRFAIFNETLCYFREGNLSLFLLDLLPVRSKVSCLEILLRTGSKSSKKSDKKKIRSKKRHAHLKRGLSPRVKDIFFKESEQCYKLKTMQKSVEKRISNVNKRYLHGKAMSKKCAILPICEKLAARDCKKIRKSNSNKKIVNKKWFYFVSYTFFKACSTSLEHIQKAFYFKLLDTAERYLESTGYTHYFLTSFLKYSELSIKFTVPYTTLYSANRGGVWGKKQNTCETPITWTERDLRNQLYEKGGGAVKCSLNFTFNVKKIKCDLLPFQAQILRFPIKIYSVTEGESDASVTDRSNVLESCIKNPTPQLIMKSNFFHIAMQCNKRFAISQYANKNEKKFRENNDISFKYQRLGMSKKKSSLLLTLLSVAGEFVTFPCNVKEGSLLPCFLLPVRSNISFLSPSLLPSISFTLLRTGDKKLSKEILLRTGSKASKESYKKEIRSKKSDAPKQVLQVLTYGRNAKKSNLLLTQNFGFSKYQSNPYAISQLVSPEVIKFSTSQSLYPLTPQLRKPFDPSASQAPLPLRFASPSASQALLPLSFPSPFTPNRYWVLGTGYWVLGTGYWVLGTEVLGTKVLGWTLHKKSCSTIRPLLSLNRFEIKNLCLFLKLPLYPDKSNQKVSFLRNRVRKQLLPTIKLFFNSRIENVLLQFADLFSAEDHYMNQIVNQLFRGAFQFIRASLDTMKVASPVALHENVSKTTSQLITFFACEAAFGFTETNSEPFSFASPVPQYPVPLRGKGVRACEAEGLRICFCETKGSFASKEGDKLLILGFRLLPTFVDHDFKVFLKPLIFIFLSRDVKGRVLHSHFGNFLIYFTTEQLEQAKQPSQGCIKNVIQFIAIVPSKQPLSAGEDRVYRTNLLGKIEKSKRHFSLNRKVSFLEYSCKKSETSFIRSPTKLVKRLERYGETFCNIKKAHKTRILMNSTIAKYSRVHGKQYSKYLLINVTSMLLQRFLTFGKKSRSSYFTYNTSEQSFLLCPYVSLGNISRSISLKPSQALLRASALRYPEPFAGGSLDSKLFDPENSRKILSRFCVPLEATFWVWNRRFSTVSSLSPCFLLPFISFLSPVRSKVKETLLRTGSKKEGDKNEIASRFLVNGKTSIESKKKLNSSFMFVLYSFTYTNTSNIRCKIYCETKTYFKEGDKKEVVNPLPLGSLLLLSAKPNYVQGTKQANQVISCGYWVYTITLLRIPYHDNHLKSLYASYPGRGQPTFRSRIKDLPLRFAIKSVHFLYGETMSNQLVKQVGDNESITFYRNVLKSKISRKKKIDIIFTHKLFLKFDKLEMKKKTHYWPLLISFFPLALQRRFVRLFLLNQNWTQVRYSQIDDFLAIIKDLSL